MPIPEVEQEFYRYINNEIPPRFLQLDSAGELQLVGRNVLKDHFRSTIENISEDDIDAPDPESSSRHRKITALVGHAVKYATLSHRWSDEELLFEDFQHDVFVTAGAPSPRMRRTLHMNSTLHIFDPEVKSSFGGKKLLNYCIAARQLYDISFCWADTCCIDKASSAELDESIRSMFRWYRNSSVCIAHLASTSTLEDMHADVWFTRGWTLQELLAPSMIRFCDSAWHPLSPDLNDKTLGSDILLRVSHITGIPPDQLSNYHPSSRTRVDRRMAWAADRVVTRDEDAAYSLMGIFDVSMSIAYGEGQSRAFCRLIEAIIVAGGHMSVLNWGGKCARHPVSSAMPASPKSYCNQSVLPYLYNHLIFELEMAMTNRGLRLPAVIIHVKVINGLKSAAASRELTLELSRPIIKSSTTLKLVTVTLEDEAWVPVLGTMAYPLALCVTQYHKPAGSAQVRMVSPMTGYLVHILDAAGMKLQRIPTRFIQASFGDEGLLSDLMSESLLRTVYI